MGILGYFFHLPRPDIRENTTLFKHAGKEPFLVRRPGPNAHTEILGVKPFWWRKDRTVWRKKKMPWGNDPALFNNHSNGWPEVPAVRRLTAQEWLARPTNPPTKDKWGTVWYDASEDIHGIPIACGLWLMWHPFVDWKEFDYIVQLFAMELAGRRMPELHYIPFEDIHEAIRAMDLEAWGSRWAKAADHSPDVQEIWRRILIVIRKFDRPDVVACSAFASAFRGFPMKTQRQAMMHCLRTAQRQRDITEDTGNHYIWMDPGNGFQP